MAFEGYLIKAGSTLFPHNLIKTKSYKTTPNQREEIESYRDDNTRALTRVTAQGKVSKFSFSTVELNLAQLTEIKTFFDNATTDADERKVNLTYWNMEDLCYYTSAFYRPDMEYTINKMYEDDMDIDPIEMTFIEYDPTSAT